MLTEDEALAGIRVLIAVAQADGKIAPAEREMLADALTHFGAKLPGGVSVDAVLDQKVDVVVEGAKLRSPAAKDAVFQAAIAMATLDGTKESEQRVLTQLRATLAFDDAGSGSVANALQRAVTSSGRKVVPIQDAAIRAEQIGKRISREAFYATLFAMLPIPIFSDIAITLTQVGLIESIATYYGHPLSRKERLATFAPLLGLAMLATALHAVTKLVPVWGTVAAGAIVYATTVGLGRAVTHYFDSEGKATTEELRKVFLAAKAEGKAAYGEQKKRLDAATKTHSEELKALAKDFSEGTIDLAEYEARADKLVGNDD
jgi:uncharacterized protein (DUF697 family)/tellurite resistance protein